MLRSPECHEILSDSIPDFSALLERRDSELTEDHRNYRKYEREYVTDKLLGKGGFGLVFQGELLRH